MSVNHDHLSSQNQEPNPEEISFSELYALAQKAVQGEGSRTFMDDNRYKYTQIPAPSELVGKLFCSGETYLDPRSVSDVAVVEDYADGQEEPVAHSVEVAVHTIDPTDRESLGLAPLEVSTLYVIEMPVSAGEESARAMIEYAIDGSAEADGDRDILPEERKAIAELLKAMAEEDPQE